MMTADKGTQGVRRITYLALVIGVANLIVISLLAVQLNSINRAVQSSQGSSTTTTTYTNLTATGADLIPPTSFADAPVITTVQPAGQRLTDLNEPFNSTELAVINGAPDSYFQTAGEMFLNNSLTNLVGANVVKGPELVVNGKPSVVYLGANTCIYCGENRWAMALALGKFGTFGQLFKGYSSLQDGDLPTVYWAPSRYNVSSGIVFGSFYNSTSLSFVTMEYQSPITDPVQLPSLAFLQQQATQTGSFAYTYSVDMIGTLNLYTGTPYTVWGRYIVPSADAQDFGNSSTTSTRFPLANLTHDQVLAHLSHPNDQFSWTQYAAADLYVAMVCSSISSTPPVCQLSAIQQIEHELPQASGGVSQVAAGNTTTSSSSTMAP
ncbi:MAG TPA: DUF929 family protein [Nitrososphaerales archaeon]|nr:DUF929 family protein [Nitrososphaerales archaeon]